MIKLSENFVLNEFFVSADYPEVANNMRVPLYILENIQILVTSLLQPIRSYIDESIDILSGIRTYQLNHLVKGADSSDHMIGAAADITSDKIYNNTTKIAEEIKAMGLPYRQLIFYPNERFIHVSINTENKLYKCEFKQYKDGIYSLVA